MSDHQPIKCPRCGSDMASGLVVGRAPGVKFKPDKKNLMGDLTGIPLTKGVFSHEVDALRCPECGIVVIVPPRQEGKECGKPA